LDWVVIGCFNLFRFLVATVVDQWFVANRGEDLVVAKDNENACFSLKCMSNAKLLEAPITVLCFQAHDVMMRRRQAFIPQMAATVQQRRQT
jgi:hypothetical protein